MVRLLGRCIPIICMPRKKRQSLPICEQELAGTKHHQEEINKLFVRRVESIRVTQKGAIFKRFPLQTINERHQQQKKTKSKTALNNSGKIIKPDDTEFDCETHISDRQSNEKNRMKSKKKQTSSSIKQKSKENFSPNSRTHLERLFNKRKKIKEPSPAPSSNINITEENHDDTISSISSSISSEWSTSTYPDSHSSRKSKDLINSNQRRQSMPASNLINQKHEIKHQSCLESFSLNKQRAQQTSTSLRTNTSLLKIKDNKTNNSSPSQQNRRSEIKPSAKSKQVLQNVRKMINDQSIQEQHFNDTRQRESVRL
ncbi:unnamed protein product [Rotaria sp. Silwood1]|nr:unnamed protein product [Rotaria sp. Silwood1]CAF1483062.1 unnamed protein product [Rotaria sp. Silwood1]CAF1498817.1 unnamed protein product [Rotaria sp. Silwood1]CAF3552728.1 unnamed protein product [Rotaria sp. Silwood1]CAF3672141.1 unnamed protein product [Rotaria sp. Silwood1]